LFIGVPQPMIELNPNPRPPGAVTMPTPPDAITPEHPEDEGLDQPVLPQVDVEGDRLLANEARGRLRADGFTDTEIDAWTRVYFEQGHEGDVEGLVAFIAAAEEGTDRRPTA